MKNNVPLKKKLRIYIGNVVDVRKKILPRADNGFRVLLYHSVTEKLVENEWEENTIPKELLDRQMKYLADKKYNIMNCKKAIRYAKEDREFPAKTIVISFDDGYKNFYTNALPILKKYNFCATLFLGVNLLCDYSNDAQYLSRQEIMNIKKTGLIDFGCHGITHRILSTLDEEELNGEIVGAKQKLEDLTESKIALFAYPFGHSASYNTNVIEKIKSAGFIGAFTTIFGLNDFRRNHFLLRRNRISWIDELNEFEKHLNGSYDWCALCEYFRYKKYNFDRDPYAERGENK